MLFQTNSKPQRKGLYVSDSSLPYAWNGEDSTSVLIPVVLLVEDDEMLSRILRRSWKKHKWFNLICEDKFESAIFRIANEPPDLVICDIGTSGVNCVTTSIEIRTEYQGPLFILTTILDEKDKIAALEAGADDCIIKPVSPDLLSAKIRAVLRRTYIAGQGNPLRKRPRFLEKEDYSNDLLVIDLDELVIFPGRRIAYLHGMALSLTTADFDLLMLLARNAGHVVDRNYLQRELRGIEWDGLDRTIDQRITRLRRKMGDNADNPRWIKSIRGTGYILSFSPN